MSLAFQSCFSIMSPDLSTYIECQVQVIKNSPEKEEKLMIFSPIHLSTKSQYYIVHFFNGRSHESSFINTCVKRVNWFLNILAFLFTSPNAGFSSINQTTIFLGVDYNVAGGI